MSKDRIRAAAPLGVRSSGSDVVGTGPYVVTTKRLTPDGLGVREPNRVRAVATLEAATAYAERIVRRWRDEDGSRQAWDAAYAPLHAISKLAESGGTVGPLPDGALIEVERVGAIDLFNRAGLRKGPPYKTVPEIIAAFNARQA